MATQKGRNWSSGDIVTAANLGSIEQGVSAVAEDYTPTTWANGNTVTAAALNNIEQGIANSGGGSSDFSTASMTVNDPAEKGWAMNGAFIVNDEMIYPEVYSDRVHNIQLVLYKGKSVIVFPGHGTSEVVVSGNAEVQGTVVLVTGDCTITISDLPK